MTTTEYEAAVRRLAGCVKDSDVKLLNDGWDPVDHERMILRYDAPGMPFEKAYEIIEKCEAKKTTSSPNRSVPGQRPDHPLEVLAPLELPGPAHLHLPHGHNSGRTLSGVADTATGLVFVKAGEVDYAFRALRYEGAIVRAVAPAFAPRFLWRVTAGSWTALGFKYVEARHASYAPDSPDLEVLADAVHRMAALTVPPMRMMRVGDRWPEHTGVFHGRSLLHMDLNPTNVLISPDGKPLVVDWAFTSVGPRWVELANLAKWLIRDGHTPDQTNRWLSQFTPWVQADPAHVALHARADASAWRRRNETRHDPPVWAVELQTHCEEWATHLR